MDMLKINHLNTVRYSWRHAAASNDLLYKHRTQEEVKTRYRWRSDSSMQRLILQHTRAARV